MKALIVAGFASIGYARSISHPAGSWASKFGEKWDNIRNIHEARGHGPGLGDCRDFIDGAAPLPNKDNWQSFMAMPEYSEYANNAETPEGYTKAFQDLNATVDHPTYIGHHIIYAYDPQICVTHCNLDPRCQSFNIFVSRDPSKDPGPGCANPPATANFKCALYSQPIDASMVTNEGQRQLPVDQNGDEFYIKSRGSNGYNGNAGLVKHKIASNVPSYQGPFVLSGAINATSAINEPADLVGTEYYDEAFDVKRCADLCDSITNTRKAVAEKDCVSRTGVQACQYDPCNFFNAYTTQPETSSEAKGFYCALYTKRMPDQYATVKSTKDASGTPHKIIDSFAYHRVPEVLNVVPGSGFQIHASKISSSTHLPTGINRIPQQTVEPTEHSAHLMLPQTATKTLYPSPSILTKTQWSTIKIDTTLTKTSYVVPATTTITVPTIVPYTITNKAVTHISTRTVTGSPVTATDLVLDDETIYHTHTIAVTERPHGYIARRGPNRRRYIESKIHHKRDIGAQTTTSSPYEKSAAATWWSSALHIPVTTSISSAPTSSTKSEGCKHCNAHKTKSGNTKPTSMDTVIPPSSSTVKSAWTTSAIEPTPTTNPKLIALSKKLDSILAEKAYWKKQFPHLKDDVARTKEYAEWAEKQPMLLQAQKAQLTAKVRDGGDAEYINNALKELEPQLEEAKSNALRAAEKETQAKAQWELANLKMDTVLEKQEKEEKLIKQKTEAKLTRRPDDVNHVDEDGVKYDGGIDLTEVAATDAQHVRRGHNDDNDNDNDNDEEKSKRGSCHGPKASCENNDNIGPCRGRDCHEHVPYHHTAPGREAGKGCPLLLPGSSSCMINI